MSSEKNLFHFSEGRKDRGSKQTERAEVLHTPRYIPLTPQASFSGGLKGAEVIPDRRQARDGRASEGLPYAEEVCLLPGAESRAGRDL